MKPNCDPRFPKFIDPIMPVLFRLIGVALLLVLGCETTREAPTFEPLVTRTRQNLDIESSLEELLRSSDIRPVSESSFWQPFLRDGLVVKTGKRFGDGDYGPSGAVWIRICWSRSAQYGRMIDGKRLPKTPGATQAMRWIRDAVGASFMHYANLDFMHWNGMGEWFYCTDERESNRIVIGFSDINVADQGRFDNAPTRILFNGNMTKREDYMLAAYNLFGRALNVLPSTTNAFAPMTSEGIYAAQTTYGLRRSGALIEWRGNCVRDTVNYETSKLGAIEPIDCNLANADRIWRPLRSPGKATTHLATYVENGNNTRCAQQFPESSSPLITGACDDAEPIEFRNLKWKTTGNLCVAASSAIEGSFLHLQPCDSSSTLLRWDFEFLAPRRISLSSSETCLAVAPTQSISGSPLTLVSCDKLTTSATFNENARLSFSNGLYAALEEDRPTLGNKLILLPAASIGNASKFYVSGRVISGNRCATTPVRPLADVDWRVESTDCSAPAISTSFPEVDPLEWDYHW
jgi:hypothetical protein